MHVDAWRGLATGPAAANLVIKKPEAARVDVDAIGPQPPAAVRRHRAEDAGRTGQQLPRRTGPVRRDRADEVVRRVVDRDDHPGVPRVGRGQVAVGRVVAERQRKHWQPDRSPGCADPVHGVLGAQRPDAGGTGDADIGRHLGQRHLRPGPAIVVGGVAASADTEDPHVAGAEHGGRGGHRPAGPAAVPRTGWPAGPRPGRSSGAPRCCGTCRTARVARGARADRDSRLNVPVQLRREHRDAGPGAAGPVQHDCGS